MPNENPQLPDMLLGLKAKAAHGIPWTEDERAAIEHSLGEGGITGVLAACCILSSQHPKGCSRSLGIIREAIEREHMPPYAEMSVYEALIYVEPRQLEMFSESLFSFIEQSLAKRAINLDNTIVLLGNLARAGESRALPFLQALSRDSEPGIRENASIVLRGIEVQ